MWIWIREGRKPETTVRDAEGGLDRSSEQVVRSSQHCGNYDPKGATQSRSDALRLPPFIQLPISLGLGPPALAFGNDIW